MLGVHWWSDSSLPVHPKSLTSIVALPLPKYAVDKGIAPGCKTRYDKKGIAPGCKTRYDEMIYNHVHVTVHMKAISKAGGGRQNLYLQANLLLLVATYALL